MKKFLKKEVIIKKTVGSILFETLLEAIALTLIIFLCLTFAKDSLLALFNSIYTKKDAMIVSLISLPLVIVILELLTIGKISFKSFNDK